MPSSFVRISTPGGRPAETEAATWFARLSQLSVTISDHGIGVAPGHEERIFDRFYQVEGKDDTSFDGLGLGLYIARSVVSMYGGSIYLEADPEQLLGHR